MKKTLTFISTTFLTMALANTAQAMNIILPVDNFADPIPEPLKVFTGSQSVFQDKLNPSNVMGGQRTTELSVENCETARLECAVLDIEGNLQLVVGVTEAAKGEIRASVEYGNINMDGNSYSGFVVDLDSDLEGLTNVTFALSIDSDSDVTLDSPMIVDGDLFFDFSSLNNSQLANIMSLELSTLAENSAYDYMIHKIGFTFDPPTQVDVPEPSSLMGLASVLGLAIFAKKGKRQV